MPDDLLALWSGALRWFFGLHREVYLALGGHIRGMPSSAGAWMQAAAFGFALGLLHALTPGHGKAVVFSYFLGRAAQPWSGLRMALKIALIHVGSAVLLFLAVHFVFTTFANRPLQGVPWLQSISYGLVTAYGAWLLFRSLWHRPPDPNEHAATGAHRAGVLPYAIGLLPCPLTLLVLTYAVANATLVGGLAVIGMMTFGIAATIGLVGLIGIGTRLLLVHQIESLGRYHALALRTLEIGAAIAIIALGGTLLAASLGGSASGPFG